MADDLNQPYIGYRSAGRRRPELNDLPASADAPLAALRGLASGVLGAPGDIESLVRMLPGLSEQTFLPTSEDIERRLPLRSVSETPVGRAATGAGQIGGGFYTGPGSPLRAIAGLPSAVSRAGRDFAMAAGQPAVNVVKPKGGNWLAGSVEKAIEPMAQRLGREDELLRTLQLANPDLDPAQARQVIRANLGQTESDVAVDKWLKSKLAKYIRNEMATPEDPLRALAERGVTHIPEGAQSLERVTEWIPETLEGRRAAAGFPRGGMSETTMGQGWEQLADEAIHNLPARARISPDTGGGSTRALQVEQENPWLMKVPPDTMTYGAYPVEVRQELGFEHLADELRNAINPTSGLPENLRWKYGDLDKVTVPQAVERVAKINEWRAANKAEADAARAMNPATHTVKEYPDHGFKWVELKTGDLPEGWTQKNSAFYDPTGERHVHPGAEALADALKYEGETMGHCVGGYCPDVLEGRSRIYSLRDKKGQPHVTIEVAPSRKNVSPIDFYQSKDVPQSLLDKITEGEKTGMFDDIGAFDDFVKTSPEYQEYLQSGPPEIVQIKGKANRAPKEEYLPAVQDFVRSQKWGRVGDIQNTGLRDISTWRDQVIDQGADPAKAEAFFSRIPGGYATKDELDQLMGPLGSDYTFSRLAKRINGEPLEGGTGLTPGARGEGFAMGGLVQKYADGGLVGSNIYNSDAMQDPASAYRFADGGQAGDVRAYADGGLVANSPTADFDPARIDAIVGDLNALNAG